MPAETFTVQQIADRYGVCPETVNGWIASGELRAVNVARNRGAKKPRWRITADALRLFEELRATTAPAVPRQRKKPAADVIRFY